MTRKEIIQTGVAMKMLRLDPEDLKHKASASQIINTPGGLNFYHRYKHGFDITLKNCQFWYSVKEEI